MTDVFLTTCKSPHEMIVSQEVEIIYATGFGNTSLRGNLKTYSVSYTGIIFSVSDDEHKRESHCTTYLWSELMTVFLIGFDTLL